jgi:hypothetical protein
MCSTTYKKQGAPNQRSLTQQKFSLFTCVAPHTKSKGLPIGGLLFSKKLSLFICVAPYTKSKGLSIGGPLLSKKSILFTHVAPRIKGSGLLIDAPHIYYFQHVLPRVQKVRGSICMCSKFIILFIKFSNVFAAQRVSSSMV